METTNAGIVADPVAHISISGVHGGEELNQRMALASNREADGQWTGLARLVAGAVIGAAIMYLLDRKLGARSRS